MTAAKIGTPPAGWLCEVESVMQSEGLEATKANKMKVWRTMSRADRECIVGTEYKQNPYILSFNPGDEKKKSKRGYCPSCGAYITATYIGTQRLLSRKSLALYNCTKCKSTITAVLKKKPAKGSNPPKALKGVARDLGLQASTARAARKNPPGIPISQVPQSIRRRADWKRALANFENFHGHKPRTIKKVELKIGDPKRADTAVFWSMGTAPSATYSVPRGSKKRKIGQHFEHEYEEPPELVADASGRVLMHLPGSHGVRRGWIRG